MWVPVKPEGRTNELNSCDMSGIKQPANGADGFMVIDKSELDVCAIIIRKQLNQALA